MAYEWDDAGNGFDVSSKVESLDINGGHSFGGKGRGFKPAESSDSGNNWDSGSRRGRGGGGGGRGSYGSGRGGYEGDRGNYDGDRGSFGGGRGSYGGGRGSYGGGRGSYGGGRGSYSGGRGNDDSGARGGRYDGDRGGGGGFHRNNSSGGRNDYGSARDNTDGDNWGSGNHGQKNGNWGSEDRGRKNDNWGSEDRGRSNDNWEGSDRSQKNYGDSDWGGRRQERRHDQWGDGDKRGENRRRFRDGDDNEKQNSGWKSNGDGFGGDQKGEEGQEKRPPIYVPKEKTEEELWADSGITKGINFKDYQNISVRVSGRDPPQKIDSFCEARFRDLLMNNLRKCHYDEPTPVQQHAIPVILAKRDLMATAQTGSGKTAAYLLPIIHTILNDNYESTGGICAPQVLILSPTRELVIQIHDVAKKFTQGSYLKVRLLYGGTSMGYQNKQLQGGCNILVATPGRLIDFVNRNYLDFSGIKFLILDEADRMMEMRGFCDDIQTICSHETMVPKDRRQTVMFSATFPDEVQRLAQNHLNDYIFLAIGIVGGACKDVKQVFLQVSQNDKKPQLMEILNEANDVSGTLIFINQKRTVDFVASYISSSGFPSTCMHGDRYQEQREEALRDFREKRMKILVASAVASRGLDIVDVKHVINYDLPESIDEYVHRIGRTGRLGNRGLATSFYDPKVDHRLAKDLVNILEQAGQEVPQFLREASIGGASYMSTDNFGAHDYRVNDDADFKIGAKNQPVPFCDEADEQW